jgi:hypothetical protein
LAFNGKHETAGAEPAVLVCATRETRPPSENAQAPPTARNSEFALRLVATTQATVTLEVPQGVVANFEIAALTRRSDSTFG